MAHVMIHSPELPDIMTYSPELPDIITHSPDLPDVMTHSPELPDRFLTKLPIFLELAQVSNTVAQLA